MAEDARSGIDRSIDAINRLAVVGVSLLAGLVVVMAVLFVIAANTTDHGLLWNRVDLPLLGFGLSITAAGLLAPAALLVIHGAGLFLLDLVGRRVGALGVTLRRPAMRERRGAYLARIRVLPLVRIVAGDEGHGVGLWLVRLLLWLVIMVGPLATLLAIQIGLLRYQWPEMVQLQQGGLVVDAVALVLFHLRIYGRTASGVSTWRHWANCAVAAVAVFIALYYANPPPAGARAADVRLDDAGQDRADNFTSRWLAPALQGYNLLDAVLCPAVDWGCRYLRLDGRTLTNDDASPAGLIERLVGTPSTAGAAGIGLAGRQLRFADFTGSTLAAADLRDAVLDGASFRQAHLQGAQLDRAELTNAALDGADFLGASLRDVRLNGAAFDHASLKGARMDGADLSGAQILNGEWQGASLAAAKFTGAVIKWTHLEGIDLTAARLDRTLIFQSFLGGASLDGATLSGARLQESDLSAASLVAADLEGSRLERNNYRLLDLRDVAIGTSGAVIDPLPSADDEVLHSLWGPHATWPRPPARPEYVAKVAITLKDLACADRSAAAGIFRRLAAKTAVADPLVLQDHAAIADLLRTAIEQARGAGSCAALAGLDLAALMGPATN
ncbi:MAG TPA: pentapeptide repeat-containing protein [Methylomirabilota bacterium]|nr:pentapeptide repeat-containing protein [Methylomirabilota bacterium]